MNIREKARVKWQCRRGMLELDAILSSFFENKFADLTEKEQYDFERLLCCSDPQLYNWFIGNEKPKDPVFQALVAYIRLP